MRPLLSALSKWASDAAFAFVAAAALIDLAVLVFDLGKAEGLAAALPAVKPEVPE